MIRIPPIHLVYCGIAVIVVAMIIGPLFSSDQFSWLHHTTSEQAGQGMAGAWIMRSGFYAYGATVLAASILDRKTRPWVRVALGAFGAGLVATAVWSNASILPAFHSDMTEDLYHSLASGIVGTAFAAACAARLFAPGGCRTDGLAWSGLFISIAIPLAMNELADLRGALQRAMFIFSFLFVGREFAGVGKVPSTPEQA